MRFRTKSKCTKEFKGVADDPGKYRQNKTKKTDPRQFRLNVFVKYSSMIIHLLILKKFDY